MFIILPPGDYTLIHVKLGDRLYCSCASTKKYTYCLHKQYKIVYFMDHYGQDYVFLPSCLIENENIIKKIFSNEELYMMDLNDESIIIMNYDGNVIHYLSKIIPIFDANQLSLFDCFDQMDHSHLIDPNSTSLTCKNYSHHQDEPYLSDYKSSDLYCCEVVDM